MFKKIFFIVIVLCVQTTGQIPENGLLCFFPFNGNARDESGNQLNGTIHGGAILTTDKDDNKDSAFLLDGNDDFIQVQADSRLNVITSFGFGVWVQTGAPDQTPAAIISKGLIFPDSANYKNAAYGLGIQDGQYVFNPVTLAGNNLSQSGAIKVKIPDIYWHYVFCTFDNGQIKFYLDGALAGSAVTGYNNVNVNDEDLRFGIDSGAGSTYFFSGKIDQIRIYDHALSAAAIKEIYYSETTFTRVGASDIDNEPCKSRGCSWNDFDRDDDLDLFVANDHGINNFLYQNTGDGKFKKINVGPVVNDGGNSQSGSWGDFDNDGFLDLFVTNAGNQQNLLYHNNGDGTFVKINGDVIGTNAGNSVGASWVDYDNDGDLDIFVTNVDDYNELYNNDGNGKFKKIITGAIVADRAGFQGCSWGDYDNDGYMDLFVANYTGNNFLYHNDGDTSFTRITTGIIGNDGAESRGGSWGDYDNDGDLDLFVSNFGNNLLYNNKGDGTFALVPAGIIGTDDGKSMGSSWADFDNDGDLDLFVINNDLGNFLYKNNGDGTFKKILTGAIVTEDSVSYGSCWGDYNQDGHLDLFVTNDGRNSLYRNNGNENNWIIIKCAGMISNTSAIGAKVRLKAIIAGKPVQQMREISAQTSFYSQNSLAAHFGLGTATVVDSVKIEWPSGYNQTLARQEVNQVVTVVEQVPPTCKTEDVSHIATISATFVGTVNPNGWSTTVVFEYGLLSSTTYDHKVTAEQSPVSGKAPIAVSAAVFNLKPNTMYRYRVLGTNIAGTTSGNDITFLTTGGVPMATTTNATEVDTNSAVLNGLVNPNALATKVTFEYGGTITYGKTVMARQSPVTDTVQVPVNAFVTGLLPNMTYHYRVVAENVVGTELGEDMTFVTSGNLPIVATMAATGIDTTSATLAATVNPRKLATTIIFEYGASESYGDTIAATPATVTGENDVLVSAPLAALLPHKTYHFRAIAINSAGVAYGYDLTFTTAGNAPTLVTNAATDVDSISARLNGGIIPNGLHSSFIFQYGETVNYGRMTNPPIQIPATTAQKVNLSVKITSLIPNTTYHYRAVGTNAAGTAYGEDQTFTTTTHAPGVTTGQPTGISTNSVVLKGIINPNGLNTTVEFEYSRVSVFDRRVPAKESPVNGTQPVNVSAYLEDLTPNTTYRYRVIATNAAGTFTGSYVEFNTLPNAPMVTSAVAMQISTSSARLVGGVNPNGVVTQVKFNYGTTTDCESKVTANENPISGLHLVSVSAQLINLTPNTKYFFKIVAINSTGSTESGIEQFTTQRSGSTPTVSTETVTNITTNQATLNGIINPNGSSTKGFFDWGMTTGYGLTVVTKPDSLTGTNSEPVLAELTGLEPGITYHYRIGATNSAGTSYGDDLTFTTLTAGSVPIVTTGAAEYVSTTFATLGGTVNPNGYLTSVLFEYDINTKYNNKVQTTPDNLAGKNQYSVSASIADLLPNRTYYYRIVAENSQGRSIGIGRTFTTLGAAPFAITEPATHVNTTFATLNGAVNPNDLRTTAKFQWGESTDYGQEIMATPNVIIGNTLFSVYATLTGIAPNKTYYFRVVAENDAGASNGPIQTFTTKGAPPVVTLGEVTNITTNSARLGGMVHPNLLTTFVHFQYGADTNFDVELPAKESPVNGSTPQTVTVDVTGLESNTTYYYRLVAASVLDTVTSAHASFVTSIDLKPVIDHVPILSCHDNQNLAITAKIMDDVGITSAKLYYRVGGDTDYVELPMSTSIDDKYNVTIPADRITSRGLDYYIEAFDSDGNSRRSPPVGSLPIRVFIDGEGVHKPVSQPGGTAQSAYRLISMPLDLNKKEPQNVLADDLGAYNKTKWRLFDWQYGWLEYPNTMNFEPGKALFLIVSAPGYYIDTGPGYSNISTQKFAIALYPGWNLIGNPFDFPIPVTHISLQSNNQTPVLRYYENSWSEPEQVTVLQPFEGYAVFNGLENIDSLLVAPTLSVAPEFMAKNMDPLDKKVSWFIRIIAQCQNATDIDNIAGVAARATIGLDSFDQPEPPAIGQYVSVYFPHEDWHPLTGAYCADIRPEPTDGDSWEFEVKTNIEDQVILSFNGADSLAPQFEVWLVDEALKVTHNLRNAGKYSFIATRTCDRRRFKLLAGTNSYIDTKFKTLAIIPTIFELAQNFPNPFNPCTTIRYGLEHEQWVTLRVFNLHGEEVITLSYNKKQPAGYHAVIWDGRDQNGQTVASGLYFYQLRAGKNSLVKRMIIVR